MKIKTSHIILAGIGLIALQNGENVRGSLEKSNTIRQQQSSFNDHIRENRTKARYAAKLSKVAIERYENNCILVGTGKAGIPTYFRNNQLVLDPQMSAPLRPGAFICNQLGDTAVVSEEGRISDIARVSIADQGRFRQLLKAR
ncbi:hypothetical protein H6F61_22490 [Cyanobacteria bacterium FACHB-472]|nr:hypothetical protein [Cyanobacteria bacterium FACHB-472]